MHLLNGQCLTASLDSVVGSSLLHPLTHGSENITLERGELRADAVAWCGRVNVGLGNAAYLFCS
jgi:hypothetical protein